MKRELKIGDKVVVIFAPKHEASKFYNVGDIGIIKHIYAGDVIVNFNDQNNTKVYSKGVSVLRREYIRKYVEQEKPRFHNAQVGDEVYCRLHGEGIVVEPNHTPSYASVCVSFGSGFRSIYYHIDGRLTDNAVESTLFYRKGEEKYLTERPEPEVDWSKMEEGTKIVVKSPNGSEFNKSFYAYLLDKAYPILTKDNVNGLEEWKDAYLLRLLKLDQE